MQQSDCCATPGKKASEGFDMTSVAIFRATLLTIATAFGGLGIFFLCYSCVSAPVAEYAVDSLGIASAIPWFVEKSAEHR